VGFGEEVQAHVAAGFGPFVGLFHQHRADQADDRGPVGEDPAAGIRRWACSALPSTKGDALNHRTMLPHTHKPRNVYEIGQLQAMPSVVARLELGAARPRC
jgi:hypothetical protein